MVTSVLFVCMGNICRSPAAESFFKLILEERKCISAFDVDSAGTGGWHAGAEPDHRMQIAATKLGKKIQGAARQVTSSDLEKFDWILCMDLSNFDDLISMGADPKKTHMLLPFAGHSDCDVPDPYYGGDEGFDNVVTVINDAMYLLLEKLT